MSDSGKTGRGDPGEASRFARASLVIAAGIFITGLGWPGLIGRIPFGLLLKDRLHLPAQDVAWFWAVGTAAWYAKPAVGLLCDTWPLFGTRRRGYLLVGTIAATAAWLAFAILPHSYGALLANMTVLNLGLVFVSVSVGGMLVEEGQRRSATGRLSAMPTALEGVMSLVAGPLGGVLAVAPFALTAGAGAGIVAVMIPIALFVH